MAEENSNPNDIPEMKSSYSAKIPGDVPETVKKEMEKTREKLEEFKKQVVKKYPFLISLGIVPPQASEKIEEEEIEDDKLLEELKKDKPIHLFCIFPEEKFKELGKIKKELIEITKDMKPKIWLHVKTPVDIWNYCLDSKYDITEAVAMSFPLYDKGLLGALRVATIHKSLVLRKFEKYVVSYVIAGSLVRGTATKTSDVDIYIVIDDTDVKRMSRLELKERLRSIIYSYLVEASELAGVKNKLSPQVYILTEFWESVKDAHPVIFTFIRDGIPLYDRGAFMPWKLLLKMGKIKPSPEAIEMFMSMGDKTSEIVKKRLLDLVVGDIYWGVLTPSQAVLMLYGVPPPSPKETVAIMREIFVEKEKILEKKYVDILDKIITIYKDFEHEKIKEIKGEEVDKLLKDADDYMKRLKQLKEQIEKRTNEKVIMQVHDDVFKILKGIFGNSEERELVRAFESNLVNKGKIEPRFLHVLNDLIKAKKEYKKGKYATHEVDDVRKNASFLISSLIEYGQRCELASIDKSKIRISYGKEKNKHADLFLTEPAFLVEGEKVFKIGKKIEEADRTEFEKALLAQKGKNVKFSAGLFETLSNKIGDFDVSF